MLTASIVLVGWVAMFLVFWRKLTLCSDRIRNDARRIEDLSTRVADMEQTIAIARAVRSTEDAKGVAAAAAVVSKKLTVRSTRTSQAQHPLGEPWAQQGRAGVQSSHDIAQRGY